MRRVRYKTSVQECYNELIECIEHKYEINLSLGEKVTLKECLNHIQQVCYCRTLEDSCGGSQMNDAEIMWLNQLGFRIDFIMNFGNEAGFEEFVKRKREESLLI